MTNLPAKSLTSSSLCFLYPSPMKTLAMLDVETAESMLHNLT